MWPIWRSQKLASDSSPSATISRRCAVVFPAILESADIELRSSNDPMNPIRPPGLYEELVTRRLEAALDEISGRW